MERKPLLPAVAALLLACTPAMAQDQQPAKQQSANPRSVREIISDWPEKPRAAAQKIMEQHGPPSGITSSRLIWAEPNPPWAEIVVYKRTQQHDFPAPHKDFVQHTVYYEVPEDKMDELSSFDGSVIVYRTGGRLAARCHVGGANILTLNLAHDIIVGSKSVQEARRAYASAVKSAMDGTLPVIMQRLDFTPMPPEKAADPGVAVMSM